MLVELSGQTTTVIDKFGSRCLYACKNTNIDFFDVTCQSHFHLTTSSTTVTGHVHRGKHLYASISIHFHTTKQPEMGHSELPRLRGRKDGFLVLQFCACQATAAWERLLSLWLPTNLRLSNGRIVAFFNDWKLTKVMLPPPILWALGFRMHDAFDLSVHLWARACQRHPPIGLPWLTVFHRLKCKVII